MNVRMSLPLALLIALLPSRPKIWLLRRMGAKIGKGCHIGPSLIQASDIELGDYVHVAGLTLLHRLVFLKIGDGANIGRFNWITGAGTGEFVLGHHSAVTRFHFVEASGSVYIGDNSIVAGRASHFFTHGISPTNLDDVRAIEIGSWSYIGSSARFVPGSGVGDGTFVGMGAVVTKRWTDTYVVVAGNPAAVRKRLSAKDAYFDRPYLPHQHQPRGYAPDPASLKPLHPVQHGSQDAVGH